MDEFNRGMAARKVSRINESLEQRFGFSFDPESTQHLREVHEHYLAKRQFLIARHGYADAFMMEDYSKAVMISEAAALMLREIAPSRTKTRTRRKGTK